MKYLILLAVTLSLIVLSACDNRDKTKIEMDKSFREYIENRETNFRTQIQHIETVSYEKIEDLDRQNPLEVYRARVYFVAATSQNGSMKVYNINDTVTSYFDQNLKMVRLINNGTKQNYKNSSL